MADRFPSPFEMETPTGAEGWEELYGYSTVFSEDRKDGRWLLMSDVCKHCVQAGCLEVCPTGAIIRTEFDTVVIQSNTCNGCRDCIAACPFGVIDINPVSNTAQKCTLCYDRMQAGMEPACSKACPTDSIQFGPIRELRERAEKRVAQLHVAEAQLAHAPVHQVGRVAHALHASGDEEVAVARAHGLRGEHDRLEARAAHLVDAHGAHGWRQAAAQRRLARDVLPQPRRDDVAHEDFGDLAWVGQRRALHRSAHGGCAQLCGVYAARGGTKDSAGFVTSCPFQRISPPSLGSSPSSTRNSVVFPAPTRPVITVSMPRSIRRSIPCMPASEPGY